MSKTTPETDKLMKEAYKDKCFGMSTIFRWQGGFQKGCLVPKPDQPDSVMNDKNVDTMGAILEENQRMTCERAASTNILKTLIFRILCNSLQLPHVCSRWIPQHFTKE